MDDQYQNSWIEQAETIKTSGRWKAVNKQVIDLAEDPALRASHYEGLQNDWMFQVFSALCAQALEEYLSLKSAYENVDKNTASEIAWRARNLLELFIWTSYCSKSTEGARQFYEDAERDVHDIADSLLKWGETTKQGEDWLKDISEGKEVLVTKMSAQGIQNIDDKYARVSSAAKNIGFLDNYLIANKILSKFTHPTAAVVMRPPNFIEMTRKSFFAQGCLYFCGAFEILEIWILGTKEERQNRDNK